VGCSKGVQMRRRTIGGMLAVVLVMGACGDSGTAETTDAPADPTTTEGAPQAPTTETATTEATEPLVYVAMGDSLGNTPDEPEGVVWQYAEKLEQHFGIEVDLRNRVVGGIASSELLERLRTDEGLRADLAVADVVTTDIPINVWVKPMQIVGGWGGADPADCGGEDREQCLRDALDQYKADTDAIIDELMAICSDDVLIRLYDNFMINTGYKLETGTLDTINPYWKAGMDHVEESAARHGIPVAQVYDEFMGDSGTDDPYTKGLLLDDQLHPNAEGAALIADLLDKLGY
jgi:lysophospholipase L1-like esterase